MKPPTQIGQLQIFAELHIVPSNSRSHWKETVYSQARSMIRTICPCDDNVGANGIVAVSKAGNVTGLNGGAGRTPHNLNSTFLGTPRVDFVKQAMTTQEEEEDIAHKCLKAMWKNRLVAHSESTRCRLNLAAV